MSTKPNPNPNPNPSLTLTLCAIVDEARGAANTIWIMTLRCTTWVYLLAAKWPDFFVSRSLPPQRYPKKAAFDKRPTRLIWQVRGRPRYVGTLGNKRTLSTAGKNLVFYTNFFKIFFRFCRFSNLQMSDTKVRPTSKDSAMWTPQIAIHIWIVTQVKRLTSYLRFLFF